VLKKSAFVWLLWTLACSGYAKVYYVNQGVKYHIGDDRFNASLDSNFLDAYPVVGQQWIQGFTVSEPDIVKVHIDHIWGVDDCPYCKDMVSIDSHDMGRLTAENNHEPFDTLQPLAFHAVPGRTYYIRVESFTKDGQADDFAIENVRVETEVADVTFTKGPIIKNPGEPMPSTPEPPRSPCEGARQAEGGWLPEELKSRGVLEFTPFGAENEKESSLSLKPGEFVQVYAKVDESAPGDRVSQALEILLGEPASGWVISFAPASLSASHGNLKRQGRYGPAKFSVYGWKPGAWNELRLARCMDGYARLFLNGQELNQSLGGLGDGALRVNFKSLGVSARLAEKPFEAPSAAAASAAAAAAPQAPNAH
jgi:hypothetical protein